VVGSVMDAMSLEVLFGVAVVRDMHCEGDLLSGYCCGGLEC